MRRGEQLPRPWTSWVQTLLAVIAAVTFNPAINRTIHVAAEGNIGCLFAETLCIDGIEFCYDDFAFGKCVPQYGTDDDDLAREPLSASQSNILATMLQELQGAGLEWDHPFVQCRIQGALFALRAKTPMPHNLCVNLAPDPEILGPQSPMAYVRFTPPQEEDYIDEVYYPPPKKSLGHNRNIFNPPPLVPIQQNTVEDNLEFLDRLYKQDEDFIPEIDQRIEDLAENYELQKMLENAQVEQNQQRPKEFLIPDPRHKDSFFKERQEQIEEKAMEEMLEEMAKEQEEASIVKAPRTSFREVARAEHIPEVSYYKAVADSEPEVFEDSDWIRGHLSENSPEEVPAPAESGVYTEGGVVYLPGQGKETESEESREEARNLLANMLGFTRHERLDVKKPGPPAGPPPSSMVPHETPILNKEVIPAHIENPKSKKLITEHSRDDHGSHSVDTEFAHVYFKNPIDNWRDGERIVQAIAELLNMQNYLTYIRVDQHEVSFRVDPNPEKKTAFEVAKAINDNRFKTNLSRRLGVNVIHAGVGDKTKDGEFDVTSSKMDVSSKDEGPNVTHLMIYMFAGAGVAAALVAVITIFVIKRHDKKKDKLGGLQSGLTGGDSSSKDYQELCRARMAGKGNDSTNSGRITTLAKENERPPSSRSSTSSWSEEPMTNMDISTGHMVLSYMEDHLRNKGRLQREWEALCRYEAEPNSRDAALAEQCEKFNRDGAPLPYDHSRVVLNHLANAEGLDYVNASTITDHDPRAPAYVAAQGPMLSTVAHFWQMVWEQGAVVIVALCRLQENGEISCTRYWPEEGAETYHIYEVHLVSEHIWCDDYLVRSFYLKNLQTAETRTVTQFHFLTWPQSGVPVSAKALLEFRRKVNKSYRGRSCPIVVHSSNGAGRTGAYILLDLVLGRMNKGAREIDIAATLEHLRDQRAGLVESRAQFEFVLMAVAEEVHAILKALPSTGASEKRDLDKDTVKENENEEKKQQQEEEKDKDKKTPKK